MSDWSSAVCSSDLVARQQIGKDRFLVGFIFDRGAARCRDVGGRRDRNHLLARGFLQQRRTELGIEEMRDVEGAGFVKLHHLRSEEHTSELQSLMRNSYAVFCLKKKKNTNSYIYI